MSLTPEQIARVAHEVNRAYCQFLGDYTQPVWEEAPARQQDSVLSGVELHMREPWAGPAASHAHWHAQKFLEGWRYGPVKDAAAKTHPCMVPFDELPREQQAKDWIFRAVVLALAPRRPADPKLPNTKIEMKS